jgi:membrane protease YdiL (CAAX protease family)
MNKSKLLPILAYFLGAFSLTFAFNQLPEWIIGTVDCKDILCGWGPLFSALACYRFFKVSNHYAISLRGAKPSFTWAIVFLAVLLPLLTIDTASKTTILSSVMSQFIYSFGEEFGWRHYLQNATVSLNSWGRYLLIVCLWFLWHYSFTNDPVRAMSGQPIPALIGIPLSIGLLSLFSFLWGDLVIKTRSILLPTIAHYLPKAGGTVALGVVVTLLILVQVGWKRLVRAESTSSSRIL